MRTVSSTFGWATKFMASTRELTISSFRHAEVRILPPQPRSPVSGVLFLGGGESPAFPRVRLGCPSLWSAIFGISIRAERDSGAGLCWRFSNFRFGGAETGSIADRESGLQGALQNQAYAGASPRHRQKRGATI